MHVAAFPDGMLQKLMFMRDNQIGDVQVLQDMDEALPGGFVQAGGGLIQQEQLRLHGQDRGQGDQLFFAPGKLIGHPVFKAGQAQTFHSFPGDLNRLGRSFPLVQRAEGHILENRGTEELIVGMLKEQTHLLPDCLMKSFSFLTILPENPDAPRLGAATVP